MRIEYIGLKPRKEDNVAATGIVWGGPGDVQDVPEAACPALLKHSGVWRAAAAEAKLVVHRADGATETTATADKPPADEHGHEKHDGLDKANDKAALIATLNSLGVTEIDGRTGKARLIELIEQRRAELAQAAGELPKE